MSKATEYCNRVFDGTHDSPKPTKSGYKLLTSKNIMNGYLDKTDSYYISEEDYININKRSKVQKWDVLFSMIGTVGNVCIIEDDNIDYAIKNMGVFSCGDEYKAKWLYFYLQSPYLKKLGENYLSGAIQKFLPLGWLRELNIPDYDLNKKQIVDILWTIDSKLKNNNKINSELESMAKTLYDYWFLQFEFPNKEGKPYKSSGGKMVWNEELKREIPEGWEVLRVKDCIEHINTGLNPRDNFILNDGDIKYVTVKNLTTDGQLDFSGCDTISQTTKEMINKRSMVSKGDILFASIAPLGRCFMIRETPKDWEINESVFSIRPNKKVSSEYLYKYFISDYFIKKAENSSTGSIFAGIRISVLENMDIVVPPSNVIKDFTDKVSSIYDEKYNLSIQNQELSSLRDFLLPLLMNGQVTFKDKIEKN